MTMSPGQYAQELKTLLAPLQAERTRIINDFYMHDHATVPQSQWCAHVGALTAGVAQRMAEVEAEFHRENKILEYERAPRGRSDF